MKIEKLRDQHAIVKDRAKLAFYHAEQLGGSSLSDLSRTNRLQVELERALIECGKLSKMVEQYNEELLKASR